MCYCTPNSRTPFCSNCHDYISRLESENERLKGKQGPVGEVQNGGRVVFYTYLRQPKDGDLLYTAPPDLAAKVAELQASRDSYREEYLSTANRCLELGREIGDLGMKVTTLEAVIRNGETYSYGINVGSEWARSECANRISELNEQVKVARQVIYVVRKYRIADSDAYADTMDEALVKLDACLNVDKNG